jgi:hypothetical protein
MKTKRGLIYVYLFLTATLAVALMACSGGGGETVNEVMNEIAIEYPTLEETFSTDCNEIWVSGETTHPATQWGSVAIEWENRSENGYLQGTGQTFVNTCTGWFMGYTWDYACDAGWGASIPLEIGDNVITITAVDSLIETVIGQDTITVNKPVMSYSIKGGIMNIDGWRIFNMRVNLDAPESYTYTDPNGNYELKCLRNGTYSVVADSYGFYSPNYRFYTYMDWPFIPDGRLVTITNSDVTGQDFSTEVYEVSGMIRTQAGYGFQKVDVLIIRADGTSASTWTDEGGIYSFLVPNGMYTIRPSTYHSFTPAELSIEVNGSGVYFQDFSAN